MGEKPCYRKHHSGEGIKAAIYQLPPVTTFYAYWMGKQPSFYTFCTFVMILRLLFLGTTLQLITAQ
jgi:hypothetical protein